MASPLDRWCKGKPPLVGRVAKEFAWPFFHLVSGAFEISSGNRDSRFGQDFQPQAWLDFYHNPERLPKWYFDTGVGPGTWEKLNTWTANEFDTADDLLLQLDELCDVPDSDNDNESSEQVVSIEVEFIARVFIPSILVYRQTPWRLFELATKHEDYVALEQLLRIDRLIVFDPTIQRFWIDAFRGTNEALRKHFLRALKKTEDFPSQN